MAAMSAPPAGAGSLLAGDPPRTTLPLDGPRMAPQGRAQATHHPALAGQRILVTGGAGFIGSHTVEALAAAGAKVTVLDDLCSGRRDHLEAVAATVRLVEGDARKAADLDRAMAEAARGGAGVDQVWHLAANPEVRTGETDPFGHYDRNVGMTFQVLEACRRHKVPRIAFTSTSTVYGDAKVRPTPEDYGPLLPISVYGGCKLACEALISSYAATFGVSALLFRFANVVGPRSTHGVTYDFVQKLRKDPGRLEVLGDGTQTKSYVSVRDTVAGMLWAAQYSDWRGGHCEPFNIGSHDAIPVTEVARIVSEVLGANPRLEFKGGPGGAGWKGDVKNMGLAIERLSALGWEPKDTSGEAIRVTAEWLKAST